MALSLPRMVQQSLRWASALFLLIFWLSASEAFLKGFDFLDAESPGRSCMVHGRTGVCMYSMVCTYAGGQHLGTCRCSQLTSYLLGFNKIDNIAVPLFRALVLVLARGSLAFFDFVLYAVRSLRLCDLHKGDITWGQHYNMGYQHNRG